MVACMGKVRRRRGWRGGDVVGAAGLWVLGVWHKGRGSGRRFGMGGPTVHGPADGVGDARRQRDGTLLNAKGQKPFRLAYFDRVFLKL
jgi:hypothetical protein